MAEDLGLLAGAGVPVQRRVIEGGDCKSAVQSIAGKLFGTNCPRSKYGTCGNQWKGILS
jgi:hypothetical protein